MGVGAAVVGGAVIGGMASKSAAGKQADAAGDAADQQAEAAAMMREDLAPYATSGKNAINPLLNSMGFWVNNEGQLVEDWTAPMNRQFKFDATDLQNAPGYQFALQQGLKGTNNALASQGLGLSGAQAKGLSTFATGLADQTYGNQFNRALSTFNTNYQTAANKVNNLQNFVNMGQNSAAQQGQGSINAAASAGNFQTQAGNAQAAGIMGTANAAQSGINNYMLYNALYG